MRKKEIGKVNNKNSIGIITIHVFIVMLMASISGCGIGGGSQSWKEEVQLNDGHVIVINRAMIREGGGGEWASNRSLSKPKEYRISFTYPDGSGKVIEWRSTKECDTWPEVPLILDLEAGEPIIYSIVSIDIACEVYNKYIYKNGIWIEEKLPDNYEKRTTNLFLKLDTNIPGFVDLKTKIKANAEIGYRKSSRQVGPSRKVCGA